MSEDAKICAVTGVGDGNGAAMVRRFAADGYRVAMLARDKTRLERLEREIPGSAAYPTDVSDAGAIEKSFARIREEMGPVNVLLQNAGNFVPGAFPDVSPETFEQAWRINALSLLLCAQAVSPDMLAAGEGAIIVTGATASLRGGPGTAAFAPAKAAQRSLAQSMAKSLGPRGVHVAYLVVDGVIDMPFTRKMLANRPDEEFIDPAAIAETVYHLAHQQRSAWTFEIDLRPDREKW